MSFLTRQPLTFAAVFLAIAAVTEGRPETNFASSAITSDSSGTRSSHLVGNVPDSSSNSVPSTRIYSSKSGGSDGGTTILTRNGSGGGGATILTRNGSGGSGGGATIVSGGSGTGSASVLTGTSNGGAVGVLTRSGPSGTQHVILGPNDQGSVLGRFGSSQPNYVYPGTGAGAGTSAGGASSTAFAGPGGASASAGAHPSSNNYDYYD